MTEVGQAPQDIAKDAAAHDLNEVEHVDTSSEQPTGSDVGGPAQALGSGTEQGLSDDTTEPPDHFKGSETAASS